VAPIYDLLIRAMEVLQSAEALSSLDARGLRRVLLSVVLWGPPHRAKLPDAGVTGATQALDGALGGGELEPAESDPSETTVVCERDAMETMAVAARRALLVQGLSALLTLPFDEPQSQEQLRLVVASAHLEFKVAPGDLPPSAATHFAQLLEGPVTPHVGVRPSSSELQSYERSVHTALERLLREWTDATAGTGVPPAELAIFHPTLVCNVRIAVPAWCVAVEVGHPEDLVTTRSSSGLRLSSEEGLWQRLPALRMRLLRCLGWHVVEIPFFEWRSLLDGPEQRQFLRARLRAPAQKAAAEVGQRGRS